MKLTMIFPKNDRISIETAMRIVLMKMESDPPLSSTSLDSMQTSDVKKEMKLASIRVKLFNFCLDENITPLSINNPAVSHKYVGDVEQEKDCDISLEEFKLFARSYGLDVSSDANDLSSDQSKEKLSTLRSVSVHVPPYKPSGEEIDENDLWDPEIAEGLRADDEKKRARLKRLIPGKLPITSIGKLAVKIAWGIEVDTGEPAACKEVMDSLCKLAAMTNESESINAEVDCLVRADTCVPGQERVRWCVDGDTEKWFGQATCKQTLWNWRKSLPQKMLVRR